MKKNKAYLLASKVDENIFLSRADYERMIEAEKYRLVKAGVKSRDICSVINFPLQHTIPISQAVLALGASYVPLDGTQEEIFSNVFLNKVSVLITTPASVINLIQHKEIFELKSHLKLIITAGQKIENFSQFSQKVKKLLGAVVSDHIGASFVQIFAIRCKSSDQYHFLHKLHKIKVIDIVTNKPSVSGELIVTPYWRVDSPIRYRTGDHVTLQKRIPCNCKLSGSKTFFGIDKRTDFSTNLNGVLITINQLQIAEKEIFRKSVLYKLITRQFKKPIISFIVTTKGEKEIVCVVFSKIIFPFIFLYKSKISEFFFKKIYMEPIFLSVARVEFKHLSITPFLDLRSGKISFYQPVIQNILKKYNLI